MLTYADVCRHMPTYADVCYANMTQAVRDAVRAMVMRSTNSATGRVEAVSMLTYADVC
jgi:hypothetical protein